MFWLPLCALPPPPPLLLLLLLLLLAPLLVCLRYLYRTGYIILKAFNTSEEKKIDNNGTRTGMSYNCHHHHQQQLQCFTFDTFGTRQHHFATDKNQQHDFRHLHSINQSRKQFWKRKWTKETNQKTSHECMHNKQPVPLHLPNQHPSTTPPSAPSYPVRNWHCSRVRTPILPI